MLAAVAAIGSIMPSSGARPPRQPTRGKADGRVGLLAVGLLLLATAACTGDRTVSADEHPVPSVEMPSSQPTASESPASRACDTAVLGDLGTNWRRGAVVIGPVAFVSLRYAANHPPPTLDGWPIAVYKTLIVIEPGRRATIAIEPSARRYASLLYDAHQFRNDNRYRLDDGSHEVSVVGCPGREAQFNGSFLVDAPRCVPVLVTERGQPPRRAIVDFGAAGC